MIRELGDVYTNRVVPVGTKIWFDSDNAAFVILTKPFNIDKTVLYTIIDWELGIRGPSNLIFNIGVETDEECLELLDMLTNGETEVSSRRCVELNIRRAKLNH